MQHAKTKTISVLLTEHSDRFSKLSRIITRCEYTHASIGIEGYDNKFFSFLTRGGFRIERPMMSAKFKNKCAICALYRLDVSEEIHTDIKSRLQEFTKQKKQYSFSFLGTLFCFLGIPHHIKNHYFCSQFVAELLISSDAVQLKKQPSLYLPDDFTNEPQLKLYFQGTLRELEEFI